MLRWYERKSYVDNIRMRLDLLEYFKTTKLADIKAEYLWIIEYGSMAGYSNV